MTTLACSSTSANPHKVLSQIQEGSIDSSCRSFRGMRPTSLPSIGCLVPALSSVHFHRIVFELLCFQAVRCETSCSQLAKQPTAKRSKYVCLPHIRWMLTVIRMYCFEYDRQHMRVANSGTGCVDKRVYLRWKI